MKKKKVIKKLEKLGKIVEAYCLGNMNSLQTEDKDHISFFQCGITCMNVSAQSAIRGMILELQGKKVKYGGYVKITDDDLKPSRIWESDVK